METRKAVPSNVEMVTVTSFAAKEHVRALNCIRVPIRMSRAAATADGGLMTSQGSTSAASRLLPSLATANSRYSNLKATMKAHGTRSTRADETTFSAD